MSEQNAETESRLNVAVHTPVEELSDEQKTLITESWAALDEAQMETYASLKPEVPANPEAEPATPEPTPEA